MESPSEQHETGEDLSDLRRAAIDVVQQLVAAGHVAYFAGGCVRDRLMGHVPTDYDVATSALPAEVAKIFPRVQTVGESFGVMLVRVRGPRIDDSTACSSLPVDSHVIQVATFRTEGVYSDGRHPDTVQFTDAEHDASRRDFTINGLFEDPLTGKVIDYVDGQRDIQKKIVRAIGNPHARLKEDRLRMLRAVRFAARFAFSIEPETADAIRTGAEHLQGISRERVGQEIKRMLTDPNRAVAAWEIQSLGLDEQVLKEPSQRVALSRLSQLPDDATYATALAAWLLDRHSGAERFRDIASRWADDLVLSNDERFALISALEIFQKLTAEWSRLGVAKQKRMAASPHFSAALQLLQATNRDGYVEVRKRVMELSKTDLAPPPLIDGADLIAQGMRPGPVFSRILEAVYDAQLEGAVVEKTQAMHMADTLATGWGNA